ncbi:MAG: hypothetical protein HWN65_15775 [Candidatus Helarchaeota archaeon]|nr:hypothetical protein [Candidatus Helarchaeota archaeon]
MQVYTYKILLIGKKSPFKAEIVNYYPEVYFQMMENDIGINIVHSKVREVNKSLTFHFWDTSYGVKFNNKFSPYYKAASGCIFILNFNGRKAIQKILRDLQKYKVGPIFLIFPFNSEELIENQPLINAIEEKFKTKMKIFSNIPEFCEDFTSTIFEYSLQKLNLNLCFHFSLIQTNRTYDLTLNQLLKIFLN